MGTILFVDGENFKKKCAEILNASGVEMIKWTNFNFQGLFDSVLKGIAIEQKRFYAAKLLASADGGEIRTPHRATTDTKNAPRKAGIRIPHLRESTRARRTRSLFRTNDSHV